MPITIFISHITEEKELANITREIVETAFPHVTVFQSSDDSVSLPGGQNWLLRITENLKECEVIIVLSSPMSLIRPWVNFEAGAGYIRGIPVIPLNHSGMRKSHMPPPLSALTGYDISVEADVLQMINTIADQIKSRRPRFNPSTYMERIRIFESDYTYYDKAILKLNRLAEISILDSHYRFGKGLKYEHRYESEIGEILDELRQLNILTKSYMHGNVNINLNGYSFTPIMPLERSEDEKISAILSRLTR